MVFHLGLQDSILADSFCKLTQKHFTWDNRRHPPANICTRIDRAYLNPELIDMGGHVGIWRILLNISDHAPIFIKLQNLETQQIKNIPFNRQLVTTEEGRKLLLKCWQDTIRDRALQTWNSRITAAVVAVKRESDAEGKRQKTKWFEEFELSFEEVYTAEVQL